MDFYLEEKASHSGFINPKTFRALEKRNLVRFIDFLPTNLGEAKLALRKRWAEHLYAQAK